MLVFAVRQCMFLHLATICRSTFSFLMSSGMHSHSALGRHAVDLRSDGLRPAGSDQSTAPHHALPHFIQLTFSYAGV
jgi:hypothetical protein